MTAKKIIYEDFNEAVTLAFKNDLDIFKLYDPNVKVNSLEEIADDICSKIKCYNDATLYSVYKQNDYIGYFVHSGSQLISFAVAVKYRIYEYLKEFLEVIKKQIGSSFFVLLWYKNIRAIKYLMNNGLTTSFYSESVIKLSCQ